MDSRMTALIEDIHAEAQSIGRDVRIMEVCGTHTVSIFRSGIRSLLPDNVTLVSGPGCPVCVTAQRHIDAAIALSRLDGVIVTTYGDMMRVPGSVGSLETQRAMGSDVRVVGSSRAALKVAQEHPDRIVAFIAVGFETTTPATAAVILEAQRRSLDSFCVLAAHKLVVPAMVALLGDGEVPLDGLLCPGHVSVIIGADAYRPIVDGFDLPCVVAGFEPSDIMTALLAILRQIEQGVARLENRYPTAVSQRGNEVALGLIDRVFAVADVPWRALGTIADSGLALRSEFECFDALVRFGIEVGDDVDHPGCRCGEVLQGKLTPDRCELFANGCTPLSPIGPCMVSSEGTCSAWYKYHRSPSRSAEAIHSGG